MTWDDAEKRFAEALPNFKPRSQQRLLATAIEDALAAGTTIIGQGGCGVGKSFALTVPLIDYALDHGCTVAISTATKALQDQYVSKDVPFLQETLGRKFTAAVLKGRGNYVCRAKLAELKPGEVSGGGELLQELADNDEHSGDLADLATPIDPRDRSKLVSSSDECPGKRDCPFGDVCFAERAKRRASEANLIIVNHAALISDLKIKEEGGFGILPELGAVGIDESHELEGYATNALGSEFTQRGIQNLAGEVTNVLGQDAQNQVGALLNATEKLFTHLGNLLGSGSRYGTPKERTAPFGDRELLAAESLLGPFLQAIMGIKRAAEGFAGQPDPSNPTRIKRLKKRINSLLGKAQSVIFASSADMIRWVESDDRRGVVLKYAPLHVGDFLNSMIWSQMPAALVSATVAIGTDSKGQPDFSFVAERHGIKEYEAVDAGSPFDFERQATLYVPENVDPSDTSGWKTSLRIQGLELIRAAGGRTLLLFSAKSNMKAAHEALAPSLKKMGLQVLMQGEGTTKALTEAFREDETSVLFGLKSFATGFDIQGDALRLVIIDKMPFPVPSDVIFKARCDAIDAKKTGWNDGSFMKLSVPTMALDLLQGAGRLIRTLQDEGQIVIFDSRLLTKGYGKKILKALPPARRVGTLPEASGYLEDLSARRS
jgi:ATP-dependent DNA helicase DinG